MKFQRINEHFQRFIKIYIIIIFVLLELSLYFYTQSLLNHKAIPENQDGIRYARALDLENSEKKFLNAATFNFKSHKISLNRAIMYYKKNRFSDSENILKKLEDSNFFYIEAYEFHGQNSFAWGRSLLNETNCTFEETLPLWEFARKKFYNAALFSIFQLNITSYYRNTKLESEMGILIVSLPEWRENCLKKNSEERGTPDNSGDNNEVESKSEDNLHLTQNNKDLIKETKKSRQKIQSSLEITPDEEKALLNSKEEFKNKDYYKEGEYTRFREESMEVLDLDILREIMEKAKW